MTPARRASVALLIGLGLAGCASSPSAPVRYYRLRIEPPAQAAPAPAPGAAKEVWQLMSPVRMPDYLDREELWSPADSGALQSLEGHRWLEPLREAVPRTLGHDLSVLRGAGSVWSGNLPRGVMVGRQIRLELLEFAPAEGAAGGAPACPLDVHRPERLSTVQASEASITAPSAGPQPAQLVDAHRLALWRLAERIATPAAPAAP
jgi:uncharacterized lipoprotein YmbA